MKFSGLAIISLFSDYDKATSVSFPRSSMLFKKMS